MADATAVAETREIPAFRVTFTLVTHMTGYTCPHDDSIEHARNLLMLEVERHLSERLADLNTEHGLNLGVIDSQTRAVPSREVDQ